MIFSAVMLPAIVAATISVQHARERPRSPDPGALVTKGAKKHRHKSVGRCLDAKGRWVRGCR